MKTFIIQTLPNDAKCKTGQAIYEYLEMLRRSGQDTAEHYLIFAENLSDFNSGVECINRCIFEGEDVCVYIDSHGFIDSSGIWLNKDEELNWEELMNVLIPVTKKIGKRSILALGLCMGMGIQHVMTKDFPFEYVITTTQIVSSLDLEPAYNLFLEGLVHDTDVELLFHNVFDKRITSDGENKFCILKRKS